MKPKISICLSGAGTLASLHVGAVNEVLRVYDPNELVGTSAGAIVIACIAMGMTGLQMKEIVLSADYGKLIPFNRVLAPFRKYLASNRNVRAWLNDLTEYQFLGDLTTKVTFITTNLETGSIETFTNASHPDMPIADAVLASMSIPDVFPLFDHKYADGGIWCNLGVQYLPKEGNRVAFRVVEANATGPITGFIDEQERLISAGLSASEWTDVQLAKSLGIPVVMLPGGNVGFLNRGMTRTQKLELYQKGSLAARDWLGVAA